MVKRNKERETMNKVPDIFMQQPFRDSYLKCVLREKGNLPGGCIYSRVLCLDYAFIKSGLVNRWQLTAVRVELKLLVATSAFKCDGRGSFSGPTRQQRKQQMVASRRVWSLEKMLAKRKLFQMAVYEWPKAIYRALSQGHCSCQGQNMCCIYSHV